MAILRPALLLGLFLGAAPALAQGPAPGMNPGTNPGSAASPATAGSQVSGRRTTATGQTKPRAAPQPPDCRSP